MGTKVCSNYTFTGKLIDGIPNGYGIYDRNGDSFTGEWKEGVLYNGKYELKDGRVFTGRITSCLSGPWYIKFMWYTYRFESAKVEYPDGTVSDVVWYYEAVSEKKVTYPNGDEIGRAHV